MFNAETATTYEVGAKTRWFDNRLSVNGAVYTTQDHNDYYFVFLASNSTQNLGNISGVRFTGVDFDATAQITDDLSANLGFGYTDSDITKFPGASSALVVGSKAPLVSDYTLNVGLQYEHPLWEGVKGMIRFDDNLVGPTTFVIPVPAAGEPTPIARDPLNLASLRIGIEAEDWRVTRMVQEPVRQALQHRILDRRLPLQRRAVDLGYRFYEEILIAAGAAPSRPAPAQSGWTERRR
ncbi:MAG: TonB-dependent receptor [Rhizomicrobium sp.]